MTAFKHGFLTRRQFLTGLTLVAVAPLAAACAAPTPATSTVAPAKPTAAAAAAPTATTATSAAAKPTTPPAAAATAAPAVQPTTAAASTPASAVKRGGRLTLGQLGDIANLDAHSFAFLNYGMIPQVYDRLARYDQNLKLQPELAESWDLAGDGLVLNLKLRQGVKFHNGREMTSDDVVANYNKARDKATGGHLFAAVQTVDSVTATDKHGVQIKFTAPTPELYDTLSRMSIIAPESFKDINKTGIGTGPFKLTEWVPVDHVTFQRHADYWDKDHPYLDEVVIKPYNDQAAMLIALQSGTINAAIGVPYKDAKRLTSEVQIVTGQPGATWYTLYASAKKPPFDNQKLRKALQYAVDRKSIVDNVLFGYGEPVYAPWPKTSLAYNPKWDNFYPFDLDKAKALLAEAGISATVDAEIMAPTSYPELGDMALILQQDLGKIGVNLKPVNMGPEWGDRLSDGNYNVTFSFAGRSHLDPISAFDNSAFRQVNNPLFPDGNPPKAYADAVLAAKSTLDKDKRKAAFDSATAILLEESFAQSVSWRLTLFGLAKNVQGFDHTADDFVVLKNTWLAG
jgi:peptide/nickel transport system substrate-binding protein